MQEIEIERTPGFSGADGNISYASANEAFMAYLDATGQKRTKENKAQFKNWLTKAKDSGKLQSVLQGGKDRIRQEVESQKDKIAEKVAQGANTSQSQNAVPDFEEPKKPMKIMGMPPMVAVGVIIAAVGLISWGVYATMKKKKAQG